MVFLGLIMSSVVMTTLRGGPLGPPPNEVTAYLIEKGIYRRMRHTAYLGSIITCFAVPIMFTS